MPFKRPSRDDLIAEVQADMQRHLGITSVLKGGNVEAIGKAVAGARHLLHAHLDFNERQLFPHLASSEALDQWADLYGLARWSAQRATGHAAVQGDPGTVVPLGTKLSRADQVRYETTIESVVSDTGSVSLPVRALQGGAAGNAASGTALQLENSLAGVSGPATVEEPGLQDGSDLETDEQLRVRLVERIQSPPMGGSQSDFVSWAKEVPGVTRAWCIPNWQTVNKVLVQFATDGNASPIPTAEKVAEVDALLQARRPVGATLIVQAPTALAANFTVRLLPDTDDIRDSVTNALKDLLLVRAEPGGTISLRHMGEAISTAPLEVDHLLEAPAEALTAALTELPVFGSVTFV